MSAFGARLRAARMRRHITTILFAKRMGISRDTLNRLEKGDATIALGTYMRALHVLGLEKDFDELAKDGQLSRKLEEVDLVQRRASRGAQDPSGAGVSDA